MLLAVNFLCQWSIGSNFHKINSMKQFRLAFTASLLFFIATNSCSQKTNHESSSVLGTFVASTPCSQGTRPLPGMSVNEDCELIKWDLTLYQDETKKAATSYKLQCVYGMSKKGTTGFIGGGKKLEIEGTCTVIKGTASNTNAVVYQLNETKTKKTISFLKLNDDLLHLLDSDLHLMIGSAGWSYTLNRITKK